MQNGDGSIPASPFRGRSVVLVDYNAYWIETLYDYVLYTGDLALLRQVWPALVKLVDDFYPGHVAGGLLVNWLGPADYAYIPRGGDRVAYYNAQYVRALRLASALAGWNADSDKAGRWAARAGATAAVFADTFWDAAWARSATRPPTPPCIRSTGTRSRSSRASPPRRRRSRCSPTSTARCGGATATRSRTPTAGVAHELGRRRPRTLYPFISYFELAARFSLAPTPPRSS